MPPQIHTVGDLCGLSAQQVAKFPLPNPQQTLVRVLQDVLLAKVQRPPLPRVHSPAAAEQQHTAQARIVA